MANEIAVIIVAGSAKQNECFWPSYSNCLPGLDHDLIVVHRHKQHLPDIYNNYGKVILEDKIFSDGQELPHRAFGAYRHYFKKYANQYNFFIFISDDVILKRDSWISYAVAPLEEYDRLGWTASQIFNQGNDKYPHPSHLRAPFWASKTSALKKVEFRVDDDHAAEMSIADQFVQAGYFGIQVGNKIDLAYDALENGGYFPGDHISALMEAQFLGHNLKKKFDEHKNFTWNEVLFQKLERQEDNLVITSPHVHIGERKVISQLEPFNNLIYDQSLHLVNKYDRYPYNINLLS